MIFHITTRAIFTWPYYDSKRELELSPSRLELWLTWRSFHAGDVFMHFGHKRGQKATGFFIEWITNFCLHIRKWKCCYCDNIYMAEGGGRFLKRNTKPNFFYNHWMKKSSFLSGICSIFDFVRPFFEDFALVEVPPLSTSELFWPLCQVRPRA